MAITPKITAAMLEKADPRKVIRQEVIQEFANLMKAGTWPNLRLRFANDGSIVQGANGHAIVQCGRMSLWAASSVISRWRQKATVRYPARPERGSEMKIRDLPAPLAVLLYAYDDFFNGCWARKGV
jgi:hypothetical protein